LSFVEKNKAWLLPLLSAGVVAVVFVNLRSLRPSRPAPALPERMASAPALPAPPSPPAQRSDPPPGTAGDLWGDLKPLARPPAAILEESALRDRSRENLDALLDQRFPTDLPRPGLVREAQPIQVAEQTGPVAKAAPAPPPMPDLEFILSAPGGLRAWFQGHPYREGQTLSGGGYRVGSIQWDEVTLIGPAGTTLRQQTHSRNPAAGSRPVVEAP
jgi:hypothetical protein